LWQPSYIQCRGGVALRVVGGDGKGSFESERVIYCNVDDKALLGNDPVKQQWKRSDRCYAMTHYTHVNNGDEDIFSVVGAVVISRVLSSNNRETTVQSDS
jgi:hypothetical protein